MSPSKSWWLLSRRHLLLGLLVATVSANAQTVTFSGRVTDQNTGQGIAGVAIFAQGNQTGTRVAVSDAQGNYSLPFGANSTITLRAYRSPYFLNPALAGYSSLGGFPITGSIGRDFTGTALPFPILIFAHAPILLTEDESLNLLTLDGVLQTRDPIATSNSSYFGADKRTRIHLFLVDIDLFSGETLSIISVNAIDTQQISHALIVEDLRKVPGVPWLNQLTVRLPGDISVPNELSVTVTARTLVSNAAKIHIK